MTKDPVTVAPDTPISQIAGPHGQTEGAHPPGGGGGKIVGIIGKMDLVRAMARNPKSNTA